MLYTIYLSFFILLTVSIAIKGSSRLSKNLVNVAIAIILLSFDLLHKNHNISPLLIFV